VEAELENNQDLSDGIEVKGKLIEVLKELGPLPEKNKGTTVSKD
jgi:hypothetical protein